MLGHRGAHRRIADPAGNLGRGRARLDDADPDAGAADFLAQPFGQAGQPNLLVE